MDHQTSGARAGTLLFDRAAYLATLPHVGVPLDLAGFPQALLRRPIAASDAFDLIGPWPYGTLPSRDALAGALPPLRASGALSLTLIARPDQLPEPLDGYATRVLKPHFVIDPALPPTPLSAKASGNLATARRAWTIDDNPPPGETIAVAVALFADLMQRRSLSEMTRMPPEHFELLFALPQIRCLAIRDDLGIGGLIVAAQDHAETHLLHMLVAPRAQRNNGSYLLMETVRDRWAACGPVYLGGVPAGAENAGIGKFKQRWANRTVDIHMLTSVLDGPQYEALSAGRAEGYFPAYRGPRLVA